LSAAEERLADDPRSELWGEHRARYRFAVQRIRAGERVLDVACGAGFGLTILRSAGARPFGVDYDAPTLKSIQEQHWLVQADAICLPLPDGSVDTVVSFETLEHVGDAAALVRELRRVLKPGGQLFLSTPNRAFGPPELHTNNPFHVREFTAYELHQLLATHFETVQLLGQRPSSKYRYVPYLMYQRTLAPDALLWKALVRLPFPVKNRLALAFSGRTFYPSETDYCFDPDATDGAHALLAVAA
jgi:ubiquinone/menaquinone biosynthesis C-methylase UbiE